NIYGNMQWNFPFFFQTFSLFTPSNPLYINLYPRAGWFVLIQINFGIDVFGIRTISIRLFYWF
ncbi:MAG: hypothetical protein PHV87_07060, partial [Bacilli bacterium]|nr:hypothetical protein [Bacilli bacterium]